MFIRLVLALACIGPVFLTAADDPPAVPTSAAKPDTAAWSAATAAQVPWVQHDRVLIVGDLLTPPGQPELALRLHEALAAARPEAQIVVRGLQNHGISIDRWRQAALDDISRRPPRLLVVMAGVGDILAAQEAKTEPMAVAAWQAALLEIVQAATKAGAACVVATPAILGDKPADGPGAARLDAYAEAARSVAQETKSELCDLRQVLIAALSEKNPKGTRELGALSKAPGQLRNEGLDLVATALARSIALAVPRIPWSIALQGGTFSGTTTATVQAQRISADRLEIRYTTNGDTPDATSPLYSKPLTISKWTEWRVLATLKGSSETRQAQVWYMDTRLRAAEKTTPETLPGLWVEHIPLKAWRNPMPPVETLKPDFETWWPNCELDVIWQMPVHRWPDHLFGLRFSGWFIAPVDGVYIFACGSDDAARLLIGDQIVVRNDDLHPVAWQQGAIELVRGYHPFTLLYGQGPGITALEVKVGLPGQRLQRLPDLLLRRPTTKPQRKGLSFEIAGEGVGKP
jgi:lysophospholipase L1-like esterase